jgi:hypothetical protein
MKITFKRIILLFSSIVIVSQINGQSETGGLDSVPISKPKAGKALYKFMEDKVTEIELHKKNDKVMEYESNPALRDLGNRTLTSLTGLGFNSKTDVNWKISGSVQCNGTPDEWTFDLFCKGFLQKERERVTNYDGSRSVETNEIHGFNWEKDSRGVILENNDTIGFFLIVMNPREDSLLKASSDYILPQHFHDADTKLKFSTSFSPSIDRDYGISGKFRGRDFFIISNGTDHKAWISLDNILRCKFYSGLNFPGISKKFRTMPYLLINNNIADKDRLDLYKLSILSCFLNNYLNQ